VTGDYGLFGEVEDEIITGNIPEGIGVIGLYADFENYTFTRLSDAVGKSAGTDFNVYNMYGNRKVCAVQDDGTVSKWYGEDGYVEDGSIGQIMVRQPKFYYKVVPLRIEKIAPSDTMTNPKGYHLRKAAYYISDKPLPGFKVHPAFIGHDGTEKDCYYIGSYEASLWDDSEQEYRKYDTWDVTDNGDDTYTVNALNTYLADATADKLCSISGVKPASGEYSTQFTRPNVNQMAKNRGSNWTAINFKMVSAEQLLFVIEYAYFNSQTALGNGVVSYGWGSHNESVFTGSTSALGNASGAAESSTRLVSTATAYTTSSSNGYKSIRYRGVENFYGNAWSYINGANVWGNGTMGGGEVYVCDDFNYAESKRTDNYVSTGITFVNASSKYISTFGWSEDCDWAFIPTKAEGNSSLPVGDPAYLTVNMSGYRIYLLGGCWHDNYSVGPFYSYTYSGVGTHSVNFGGRLAYIE